MKPAPSLIVRRRIAASAERLFRAWTDPAQLVDWWGPRGVTCESAEVDLREGGRYRLSNRLPDGSLLWISGEFEVVEPPSRLVYSWYVGDSDSHVEPERVTVSFDAKENGTEITILHERIRDATTRARHEIGWEGCLSGLAEHASR